jgi:amino acid transporter
LIKIILGIPDRPLFLYRSIYAEVVGALPLNGGAYNALLNTTSKYRASSIAACLTILSYMATAVISASEAMHYVHTVWVALPVMSATIGLLAVFMVLTIIGIEFVAYLGTFGPDLIRELSKKWEIPTNLMFIGSPGNHFIYGLKDLGGVRLII